MDRVEMLSLLDEEIVRLERVRDLLNSSTGSKTLAARAGVTPGRKKRVLSPEARQRIAQAQKRRWAKQRKEAAAAAAAKK